MKRKEFVRNTGLTMAGLSVMPSENIFSINVKPAEQLKVALIGIGARGIEHLKLLLHRKDVEVVAICDIDPRTITSAKKLFTDSDKKQPQYYSEGSDAWKKLLEKKDIQAIIIATPWELHKPMIIGSLEAGIKYVGTEVILGINLQDHWDVVKAAEKHKAHVMMLENVCYRRDVMAVLNMVRKGLFGEIIHLQGGYQHDLRGVKFNDGKSAYGKGAEFGHEDGYSESRWRTDHSVHRNGDLYPTHGIGPVAHYININRGNRFISLNSFSSKARGLHNYIVKTGGENHKNAKVGFKLGDVVTTQIACANGETVLLQHDTNLPRPYSIGFRVQGTEGIWMDVNKGIYVEGKSKPHQWDDAKKWLDEYDHPLWKKYGEDAAGAGHGGMDWFVINSFIESAKRNLPTQMDVYDAAAWSAITPLSEQSIMLGNETVEFPDFTGGEWMYRKPVFAPDDNY
ncbi:Gfo/Idh/MocA family protein [Niabella ginsengisoli]|uniref:Gfo/Idh/MocA family oxidoreductase n=1 Tax=Niabella ginsengisoli TaxID=522298 RepID=A0ABS9SH80_9BACT|nr:Gfo/Idh/MocA family oxidoreductase [Niabella ginsengisoli]MCH5597695.1 Gfo/Idh/MocA family oxidoreductase [Niabella ginsengisoli]